MKSGNSIENGGDKKGKQKQNPPTSLTSKDDRKRENHDKVQVSLLVFVFFLTFNAVREYLMLKKLEN